MFSFAAVGLLGASAATARHLRDTFRTEALSGTLKEHSKDDSGMVMGAVIKEFAFFCPILYWTVGREYFKPDGEEQLRIVLQKIQIAYSQLLRVDDFNNALLTAFDFKRSDLDAVIGEAVMLPMLMDLSITRYLRCDVSPYDDMSEKDISEFMLEPRFLSEPTLMDSFRVCEYVIKRHLSCFMEEGKEFGVCQVAPYTAECFVYIQSVTKALMDGSIAAASKARMSVPVPNHDFSWLSLTK